MGCTVSELMHHPWTATLLHASPFHPPSLPAHFIIHTLAFTDNPRCGGWGVEGWPLLIQRLGICIWLLFVNQWCDRAGRRVSPRLSLRLPRRCGLPHNTITRTSRMRRYHAVTWNQFNSSWSTHEPPPLFPFLVLLSLCIVEGETAFTDGENRNVSSGSKLCKNGTEADVVSLDFIYFFARVPRVHELAEFGVVSVASFWCLCSCFACHWDASFSADVTLSNRLISYRKGSGLTHLLCVIQRAYCNHRWLNVTIYCEILRLIFGQRFLFAVSPRGNGV